MSGAGSVFRFAVGGLRTEDRRTQAAGEIFRDAVHATHSHGL